MIDHFTLTVADLERSKTFYTEALRPLGYAIRMDFGEMVGFGDSQKPYFWLKTGAQPSQAMHIAFEAKNRGAVDSFHAAALGAGARDDGKPGVRPDYHPHYYGAFVIDPDGHPIEAVCHAPLAAKGSGGAKKTGAAKKSPAKRASARKAEAKTKPAKAKKPAAKVKAQKRR